MIRYDVRFRSGWAVMDGGLKEVLESARRMKAVAVNITACDSRTFECLDSALIWHKDFPGRNFRYNLWRVKRADKKNYLRM